jgi:hypothetical protein
MLYAFTLIDDRQVYYFGATEKEAFNVARAVHGDAVAQNEGQPVCDNTGKSLPFGAGTNLSVSEDVDGN